MRAGGNVDSRTFLGAVEYVLQLYEYEFVAWAGLVYAGEFAE